MPCADDDVIRRDVDRTLPQEALFRDKFGKGQSALFQLLHALSLQHSDIGYVQSLNFIVATLINVFPDEDEAVVFSCARSMLFRHSLVDFYRPGFAKLGVAIWQFDRLVEGFLPKAADTLDVHGITGEFYAMQWFLTLFASDLPQNVVARIWDRFLVVGWQAIAQVGLALLESIQDELEALESCAAMTLLKNFTHRRKFNAEELLDAAAKFDVSHRMLSDLEAAHNRGEAPKDTRLVVDVDFNTGTSRWSVHRRMPSQLRRSNSSSSIADAEPLPRAFSQENLHAGQRKNSSSPSGGPAVKKDSSRGSLLPFIIHNLDTGETSLLEEEWTAYLHEEKSPRRKAPAPEVAPTLLSQFSWATSPHVDTQSTPL